jgi:hypothetical protein
VSPTTDVSGGGAMMVAAGCIGVTVKNHRI